MELLQGILERCHALRGASSRLFDVIFIETISTCTNSCVICPRKDGHAARGKMSDAMFKKIISALEEIKYDGTLHLFAQNEPFLDNGIIRKIHYAKERLDRAALVLISNFTVLDKAKADAVLSSPIDRFSGSLYALDGKTYNLVCGRDNFERMFINLVYFLKKYTYAAKFSFAEYLVNTKYLTELDFMHYFVFDLAPVRYAQEGTTIGMFNNKNTRLEQSRKYFSRCLYKTVKFTADGVMSLCPYDAMNALAFADINAPSAPDGMGRWIVDEFNGQRARRLRKRMLYSTSADAHCQFCASRRSQTLFEYLTGKKHDDPHDVYKHKLRYMRNTDEQMMEKSARFNAVFRDGDENAWLPRLQRLREQFYAQKNPDFPEA